MHDFVARMRDIRFVRYLVVSVAALAVDLGTFVALLAAGIGAVSASVVGYSLGIAAHWLLSSRKVFSGHVAPNGAARHWQKALFVISALIGLGLTTLIVGTGEAMGFDARLAKLLAIACSFVTTWLLRRHIVFRQPVMR